MFTTKVLLILLLFNGFDMRSVTTGNYSQISDIGTNPTDSYLVCYSPLWMYATVVLVILSIVLGITIAVMCYRSKSDYSFRDINSFLKIEPNLRSEQIRQELLKKYGLIYDYGKGGLEKLSINPEAWTESLLFITLTDSKSDSEPQNSGTSANSGDSGTSANSQHTVRTGSSTDGWGASL